MSERAKMNYKGGRICRSCTCTPYVPIAPCHKRGGRCGACGVRTL